MKKLIAVAMLVVIMMFAGVGTAFAANSPDGPYDPYPADPIPGKATGSSGTLKITSDSGKSFNVKVNSDGTFNIDGLEFTKPGTYKYKITDPNDPSTYYTLEVVVEKDPTADNALKVSKVTYYDANGNVVSTLKFSAKKSNGGGNGNNGNNGNNTSVSGTTGTTVAGKASGVSTKTNDISMLSIAALAAAAAIAGGVSVFSRRRVQQ